MTINRRDFLQASAAGTLFVGTSLAGLFACMWLGSPFGIEGLAWGCLPPTLGLLGWHLGFVARDGFLSRRTAVMLWTTTLLATTAFGGMWLLMFHATSRL